MGPNRYHTEPDVVLVAAAQRDDRDALNALLQRHYPAVLERCRRVLNNDADASDAAQNALVAVAKGIRRFDGTSSFTTWLYRVATNAALDEIRRRSRRPTPQGVGAEVDNEDRHTRATTSHSAQTLADPKAAQRIESLTERAAIDQALAKIPPDFRAPLVLRDLCGLDYAEIAEVLQIPPGTVRSRIARGRAALAPHLAQAMTEPNENAPTDDAPTDDAPTAAAAITDPLNENPVNVVIPTQHAPGNQTSLTQRQRLHDGH
jgi:RNA polymerase sigma-70 factor, ECF subfamily